jgi:hypothetical protein
MSDRHQPGTLIGIVRNPHTASQPQMLVNIAAMSNEEARSLIEQICRLSDDVWSGLGKT